MRDYSSVELAPIRWASLEQLPDGSSKWTWNIRLHSRPNTSASWEQVSLAIKQSIVEHVDPSLEADLSISLTLHDLTHLTATMHTTRSGWADELVIATGYMFDDIDRMVGTIETIEGQPRNMWPPWTLRKAQNVSDFWSYIHITAKTAYRDWHPHNVLLDAVYAEIASLVCMGFESVTITRMQIIRSKDGRTTTDGTIDVALENKLCEEARAKGDFACLTVSEAFKLITQHDELIHKHLQLIKETEELSTYRIIPILG